MAERPRGGSGDQRPDPPDYDWLYGTSGRGDGSDRAPGGASGSGARPPADPEPTRVMPTLNRPRGSGTGPDAGADRPQTSRPGDPGARTSSGGGPGGPGGPGGRAGSGGGGARGPRGPVPPRQAPPRKSRAGLVAGAVGFLVIAWVAFLIAVPAWAWTRIERVDASPSGARPDDQPGTTYLLVGSDSRAGLTKKQRKNLGTGTAEGQRTDTIMLLHTGSGPNLLMSIPRDSLVDIPGHGSDQKINAAYAWGGPKLLVKTIESETGIRIDDYVEVGFGGFVNVVDAVGGIQICPTQRMNDKLANLHVHKGCQEADGKTALGYARSRHTSNLGDIDRAKHQREVVSAVGSKAVSPWSVLNPWRYFHLARSGADSLRIGEDTGPLATARFAWAMTHVNGQNGLTCGVPIADLAVHWDRERALRLFRLIKEDRTADVGKNLCSGSGLRS